MSSSFFGTFSDAAGLDVLTRNLTVKNEFSVPIVVHNITLAAPAARF